ncbi:MAG TPA: fumarylacetoacetate hydrolase family protein [Acidisphaera sp.]|nr:fumarylacetoacetate hydrolase family protein [Acidisphaera sp.]
MKLLRFGPAGEERPGLLDAHDTIRDLTGIVRDIDGEALSPASLAKLAALDPATLPAVDGSPRLGAAVALPRNFICIGLNYSDHAAETNNPIPKEPIIFLKSLGAYSGPYDDVVIPRGSKKTDWEVELGIVIGTGGSYIEANAAMDHVAGYTIVNDVSEREYQLERGGTWDKGKSCPTFGPIGPFVVTKDAVPDPQALSMFCDVDGHRMQDGSTRTMIFGVRKLVSYVSHFMRLFPGDVIATGTPPGVGMGKKPPVFLKPGQTMRLGIEGLGEQRQRLVGQD